MGRRLQTPPVEAFPTHARAFFSLFSLPSAPCIEISIAVRVDMPLTTSIIADLDGRLASWEVGGMVQDGQVHGGF